MNSSMNSNVNEQDHQFGKIEVQVLHHENEVWMETTSIGRALEYENPLRGVIDIFRKHEQEFLECTKIIPYKNKKDGKTYKQRFYNEEGVMLVGMFSKQPKATQFRKWAVKILKAYRRGGLIPQTEIPPQIPIHLRRYIKNHSKIPTTHFSILTELTNRLVAPLEIDGYTLPENMVPDISEGRMFCKWLRENKGIDTNNLPTYSHEYEDGRIVFAKLYPIEVLPDFIKHFHQIWLPQKAKKYFKNRDPRALEYLPKLLE